MEQEIEEFVSTVMSCRQIPGLSLAVVQGGEIRMSRGYGFADVEQDLPANGDTPFCVGSCSKAFTTTLLGILLEDAADR